MPKTAPYGSWKSPITSDLIVAQSIALSEAQLDGRKIHWAEGRPQEQGRVVIMGADVPDKDLEAILAALGFAPVRVDQTRGTANSLLADRWRTASASAISPIAS